MIQCESQSLESEMKTKISSVYFGHNLMIILQSKFNLLLINNHLQKMLPQVS
jgi:hypothetical protein